MLEHLNANLLPAAIALAECMGIVVIGHSLLQCFWVWLAALLRRRQPHPQEALAEGLATGLEFLLGAEILKTLAVPGLQELLALGAIILLRVVLSLLIWFELQQESRRRAGRPPQP